MRLLIKCGKNSLQINVTSLSLDNIKNLSMYQLQYFYEQVIQDFKKRLTIRYDGRVQGFDSEIIDQMAQRIKQELSQSKGQMFEESILRKNESDSIKEIGTMVKQQDAFNQKPISDNQSESSEEDYLQLFNHLPKQKEETIIKKQEENLFQPKKEMQCIEECYDSDFDRFEEQEQQKQRRLVSLKNNINLHIVGTYQSQNKKYVAKKDLLRLELENVFIKYRNFNQQIYCPKLICTYTKE